MAVTLARRWRLPAGLSVYIARAALIAVVAAVGAVAVRTALRQPVPESVPVPVNSAIEAKWGVRVSQVAVTADGGLIDFRFVVLDPDKAAEMMSDVDNLPVLLPDGSTNVINSAAQMGAPHTLTAGVTYFLLYRDQSGAVRRGTSLSILFGDLKIDHVITR